MYLVDKEWLKEAKTRLLEVIQSSSEVEFAPLFLGNILSAEGKHEEALKYYRRCLAVNPDNVEAQRRVRLHRMRTERKDGIFDRLFSKKTGKKPR
jgi:tetratricopeptide (TPR) repeat protein